MIAFPILFTVVYLWNVIVSVDARRWNDTGRGTIIFEEAWTIPDLLDQQK